MTMSHLESDNFNHIDKHFYNEKIFKLCTLFFQQFRKTIKFSQFFNLFFLIIFIVEITIFFVFFAFLAKSAVLALSLALIFFTAFSYAILRIYFQNKKPEQLRELRTAFINECKQLFHYQENVLEHRLALSTAISKLASSLCGKEFSCYRLPKKLKFLTSSVQKLSYIGYWEDLQKMREILLLTAIDEHYQMIEIEPTNSELHASLANLYVMLSNVYCDPRRQEGEEEDLWVAGRKVNGELQQKSRQMLERAIEELKILKDYTPDDPWIHEQLAYCYHDIDMPKEEILEYEALLSLQPEDKETLFKLGVLYFEQGCHSKGLRIYESLKQTNYKKAQTLMHFYGNFSAMLHKSPQNL